MGHGKSRLFTFFREIPPPRRIFREFLGNPREISPDSTPAGLVRRGSATSRGESPRSSGLPREFLWICFVFQRSRALFRPVAPRCPPFSGKVREKTRDFDRIRLLKVPKGKVPRSVSQAAAVLRRSVPAGAESGVRALLLQRSRGIRREVWIFGGPPGPPPGRAPGSMENPVFLHFSPGSPSAAEDFPSFS